MILNKHFFYLDSDRVEARGPSGLLTIIDVPEDRDFYYLEFKQDLTKLSDVIPADTMARIKTDALLVLCNSHEAFHSVVAEIYQHAVIRLGIPAKNVMLLSESADIGSEVMTMAQRLNQPQIQSKWIRVFERSCQMYLSYVKTVADKKVQMDTGRPAPPTLVDKPYKKKFLNFNRRWRLHRPTLVALLYARGILSLGHVSLAPCDDHNSWARMWEWIKSYHSGPISDILIPHESAILSLPDMYLDTAELMTNQAIMEPTPEYLYRETYFSVASETNYYATSPGRFLSEKIFKPIALGHPFLVVSRPNTMALLRQIGYKTFSPWVDESYDTETDDNIRLLMLLNEIERLSKLTPAEVTIFLDGIRPICKYNQLMMMNKNTYTTICTQ